MGLADIAPTTGVVTALAPAEVAALAAMGLGVPLVLPAAFADVEPAPLDQLRDHLLVDESGTPLPWFAALWSCVVQPRVVGLVSRHAGDTEFVWLFYLRTDGFVEQVNNENGVALLGASLDELPARLGLAAGLVSMDAAAPSPSPVGSEFSLSLRFTRVDGPTFALDLERAEDGWRDAGSVIEPASVAAEIERVVSSAFSANSSGQTT